MPPIDHQRARRIFDEAVERPRAVREAYVAEAAGGDERLLTHVRRLLAAAETRTDFLEKPADVRAAVPAAEAYVGKRVGSYTLTRLAGWGGMGRVYEAVQDHPRRRVALKIIGALPSPEALRRFRYECEVLARLQHPGIAQLYEAFAHPDPLTGEQLPCFAMELIPGALAIHRYASEKGLGARERVGLFVAACEAVNHAHQRGVIHRDLKPGNLLVSETGEVKVIDFGIARAADAAAATRMTFTGQMMGTLSYMSPEQASGDARDVDSRSDVYSLGVVLYELLAGRMPYEIDTASALEAARIIREAPPTRLRLTGAPPASDLEAVVLKALSKRPAERYQSAAELGQDLRRWLDGEPVSARPPSAWRQLRSLARRHRFAATIAAVASLALVLGVVGMTLGLVRINVARTDATTARMAADHRARAAQQAADFLIRVLASANPLQPRELEPLVQPQSIGALAAARPVFAGGPGRGASANDLLRAAAKTVKEAMPADPTARARVQASLGQILVNCGLLSEAAPVLEEAYATLRLTLGPDHLETAQAAEWLAHLQAQFVVGTRTVELRREAVAARRVRAGEDDPETIRAVLGLAWAMAWNVQKDQKAEAAALQRENVARAERVYGASSPLALEQRAGLAFILGTSERWGEALEEAERTLAGLRSAGLGSSATAAYAHRHAAASLRNLGRVKEATEQAQTALALAQRHFGGEAVAGLEHFETELMWCFIAGLRWDEAAGVVERQVATSRGINGPEHHATLKMEGRLGYLLMRSGRDLDEARRLLEHAAPRTRALPGEVWRAQWYEAYLAEVWRRLGEPERALTTVAGLRTERRAGGDEPVDLLAAQLLLIEGRARLDLGEQEAGEALVSRAAADLVALGADASRRLVFDAGDAVLTPR